jgi:hypothetical protein
METPGSSPEAIWSLTTFFPTQDSFMKKFFALAVYMKDISKRKVFLLALLLLLFHGMFSQPPEQVRVKAGQDVASTYSPHGFYMFPTFREGVVVFKNGGQTNARLNYHMLNQEIQFLSINGDTFALADPFSIKHITIDSSIFYYSEGYLEVVMKDETLMLARKIRLNTTAEKIGAYGQASPSGSIRTPNKLILNNTGKELTINQDIIIQREYTYYWLDKYTTVLKATKANLFRFLSPDKKSIVENYLKKNKIDFSKEADLKRLLQFSLAVN